MLKRSAIGAVLACALALAGCGSHTHHPTASGGHSCAPGDYYMNCVQQTPPQTLTPAVPHAVASGIDFAWSCPSPHGHGFGASYLSPDASKNWTRRCVNAWHAAGAKTVLVWESSATRALDGRAAGQADARSALSQAQALGLQSGRPIFFALDFDETAAQSVAVASYFRGVHDVLDNAGPVSFPTPVPVGAYGGYWAIKRLFDAGLIKYGWQTYAWSGGLWDPRAQLEQYLNGSSVDYDRAIAADYGQWPYSPPNPLPVCFHKREAAKTCAAVKAKIASDQRALASSQRAYIARGCPGIRDRRNWFWQHIHRPPASKRAYRTAAYQTSVRAYVRQSCPTFGGWQGTGGRVGFFAGRIRHLEAAN
jgi:hypothetical protein